MNRRNLLTLSIATLLGGIASRVSGAGKAIKAPEAAASLPKGTSEGRLLYRKGSELLTLDELFKSSSVPPALNLSGVHFADGPARPDRVPNGSIWCQCPACSGSGFRGEDRDQCNYCKMAGKLTTSESFGMYTGKGNAEVWRALVWHEWSQRNWRESDGSKPSLPGMLCLIGQQHPEVYDTAVRENIFVWLTKRFDKKHAEAQFVAFVAEVERNNRQDEKLKRVDAITGEPLESVHVFVPGVGNINTGTPAYRYYFLGEMPA